MTQSTFKKINTKLCRQHTSKQVRLIQALIIIFTTLCIAVFPSLSKTNEASSIVVTVHKTELNKPAIIFIPGLMSDSSVYDDIWPAFANEHDIYLVSVKGFAGTVQDSHFSLQGLVDEVFALIEEHDLDKPDIVGHSMGGLSALILASQHQDSIGSVISIDGLPFIGPIFTQSNQTTLKSLAPQAAMIKQMYASMTPDQIAQQTRQSIFIQATAVEHQQRIIDMATQSDPLTVSQAMFDVMSTDLREDLQKSTARILLLGASGGFSEESQHAHVKSLYKAQINGVANATLIMNKNARHFIMYDDAAELIETINKFIGE
jgi:pimeloyl-ACP methyl ester carboxylesterase